MIKQGKYDFEKEILREGKELQTKLQELFYNLIFQGYDKDAEDCLVYLIHLVKANIIGIGLYISVLKLPISLYFYNLFVKEPVKIITKEDNYWTSY